MSNGFFESSQYLSDIDKCKVLTKDEEIELAKRMEQGDNEAREELISRNLKLVLNIAKKYKNLGVDFEDLVQAGNMGLINAADNFDYRKGYKFSTFACLSIKNEIVDFVNNNSRTIRVPAHKLNSLKEINRVIWDYVKEFGKEPSLDFIEGKISIPKKKILELLDINKQMVDLNQKVDEDTSFIDYIKDNGAENRESRRLEALKKIVWKASRELEEVEQNVIEMRFGLKDNVEKSVYRVSVITGLPQKYIQKIEQVFVERVKKMEEFSSVC